jgi:anti-sigma-K factor RskA
VTNGHPYREEDFELYALGVIDADECKGIEAHVRTCPDCAQQLAQARGRIALLALSADQQTPSPAVKSRLFEQIRAEEKAAGFSPAADARRAPTLWWNALWATVTVALAACAVVLWVTNSHLNTEMRQLEHMAADQNEQLQHTRAIASLLTSPQTKTVDLAPKAPMATQGGRVMYNAEQGALIYAGNLPQPEAGKAYELWVVPMSGNPIPAGVFMPQSNGEANVVMPQIPTGVVAKAFAVTVEPSGGMPQPTGAMVQVGAAP